MILYISFANLKNSAFLRLHLHSRNRTFRKFGDCACLIYNLKNNADGENLKHLDYRYVGAIKIIWSPAVNFRNLGLFWEENPKGGSRL